MHAFECDCFRRIPIVSSSTERLNIVGIAASTEMDAKIQAEFEVSYHAQILAEFYIRQDVPLPKWFRKDLPPRRSPVLQYCPFMRMESYCFPHRLSRNREVFMSSMERAY